MGLRGRWVQLKGLEKDVHSLSTMLARSGGYSPVLDLQAAVLKFFSQLCETRSFSRTHSYGWYSNATKIDPRIEGRGVLVYKNDDNNKIYTNHKIIFKKKTKRNET
jgi:hypothetical protein